MRNESARNPAAPAESRLRFSIAFRLNVRFFFRLLGIFLALDLLLCLGFAAAAVARAERTASAVFAVVSEKGLPEEGGEDWLRAGGCEIRPAGGTEGTFRVPAFLQSLFLSRTIPGARYFVLPEKEGASFIKRMESGLAYRAGIEVESAPYDLTVALGETVRLCGRLFLILWILQLLMLVGSLSSNARAIRRTLRPIAELAETAESLNRAGRGALTPGEMETLAGKIDRISAAGLDTRIAVDGTQEELKNLAAAINGMLDRINESYRTQVRFVSDASHELRTPIAVIQGYANLLDRWGKHDEKVLQESIDAIKDEVNNMKTLVEQLLFLARGDNDTMTLKMERFELSKLAEEVLRETRMIDGGHRYESSLDPVFIVADTGLVKQALRILVDNAVKYTPAGGLIRISVSEKEGQAFLTVRDEGIGILPEAVPKIFDRFYRTDESRARATGGAGLGLSIARWIAQRHGGHMEVLSREGIGTRISVVLPAAPEIEAGGAADEKKTAEPETAD